jgi:hypothetical protein
MSTVIGLCIHCVASRVTSGVSVALKSMVWRCVLRRAAEHDALHVGNEPHVQHAVGFVDDEDLDLREIDVLPLAEVQQAARGGHHDVHVLVAQDGALPLHVHAAINGQGAQPAVFAQVFGVAGDLHAQLARRAP